MDSFEHELESLRRTTPSDALDARMETLFQHATARQRRPALLPWLGWLGTAVGLGGAVALVLFAVHPEASRQAAAHPTVYRIQQAGELRELLLEPARLQRSAPRVIVRVNALADAGHESSQP